MSTKFLALLAAASTASAVNLAGIEIANFGNLLAVTSAADVSAASSACVTDIAVISYCATAVPSVSVAPPAVLAPCVCCYSHTPLSASYALCAAYLGGGGTSYTSQSSVLAQFYSYCSSAGAGYCGAASASPTASASAPASVSSKAAASTTASTPSRSSAGSGGASSTSKSGSSATSAAPSRVTTPPACLSLSSVISECATPGYTTENDSQLADCLCYQGNQYTTAFDDYAAGCAPWAKTYDTVDYTNMLALTEFCESFPPASLTSSTSTSTSSKSTSTSSSTSTTSNVIAQTGGSSPSTTSTSRALAASPIVASGLVAWTAGWLTFVLSFFFLI